MGFPYKLNVVRFAMRSLEYAFAMYAGITGARARFPAPPDGDRTEGKGRLMTRGGWRFVHVAGEPYEMGFQHGRLLAPLIGNLLHEYLRGMRFFRGLSRRRLIALGLRLAPAIPPHLVAEMRGIADGAGAPYEDVLISHTLLESVQSVHCSCYAAYDSASANGEMIFGRNLEFFSMGIAHRAQILIFRKPANGIPFVSLAWPGWCGTLTAVNLEGLCLGLLNVNKFHRMPRGQPYVITCRRIVEEAATCKEAMALLADTPRAYSNNILITQTRPRRHAVVAEYSPDALLARAPRPGNDFIVATNHFRKLGRDTEWPEHRGYVRYPALFDLVQRHRGRVTLETDIFGDRRVHLPNSMHCLIAAPERKELRIALGRIPAAQGPYRRVRYDRNGFILA